MGAARFEGHVPGMSPLVAGIPEEEKMAAESAMGGIDELRRRRGTEQVCFGDVADHLVDFAARFPEERVLIDRLAAFLAEVDRIDHDHGTSAGSTGV